MINYIFHIGERCNMYYSLLEHKLISGVTPLNGIYNSFDVAIDLINNKFSDFTDDIVEFCIADKTYFNYVKNIPKDKDRIEELIKKNKMFFFYKENYYSKNNYCINLKYTNILNLLINDIYNWRDSYLALPNTTFITKEGNDTFIRRKDRFINCIERNNAETILLIYMDKLQSIDVSLDTIHNVKHTYNLNYNLFYVIPTDDTIINDTIIYNNITFFYVNFPSIETQMVNNPNDDNSRNYTSSYNKITQKIRDSYNISLISLY